MHRQFQKIWLLVLICLLATACTTSSQRTPDPVRLAAASRFIHSIGAGEFVLEVMQNSMEAQAKNEPGMAEVLRRVFADVTPQDFEKIFAGIYARHLSADHLNELANFAESRTGQLFFRASFQQTLQGKNSNNNDIMRLFNADEILEIARFSHGDAAAALSRELPAINKEIGDASRQMGEDAVKRYLNKKPAAPDPSLIKT